MPQSEEMVEIYLLISFWHCSLQLAHLL
jgi:hypothetical protein